MNLPRTIESAQITGDQRRFARFDTLERYGVGFAWRAIGVPQRASRGAPIACAGLLIWLSQRWLMGGNDTITLALFSALAAAFIAVGVHGFWKDFRDVRAWGFSGLGVVLLLVGFVWRYGVVAVLSVVVLGALSYGAFSYFQKRLNEDSARYKRWKRRMNHLVHALPVIGILVGGFLFVGCVAWMLAEGRQANEDVARTLTRYVLPRHLTEAQIKTISTYLSGFPSQTVSFLVIRNSEEASSYRADIQRALTDGGWTISGINYSDDVPEGLQTRLMGPLNAPQQPQNAKNLPPDQLFANAMKKASVAIGGSSSGGGVNVTTTTFIITIGHRRMDDGELTYKKVLKERAQRLLEQANEED